MVVTRRMAKQDFDKKKNQKVSQCTVNVVRLSSKDIKRLTEGESSVTLTKTHESDTVSKHKKNTTSKKKNDVAERISKSKNKTEVKEDETAQVSAATSTTKKYNFRQRPEPPPTAANYEKKERKRNTKNSLVRINTPCPNKLWENLKASRSTIKTNSIVLAKMRTYSPWPAKLVAFKQSTALVYFFGSGNHGEVSTDELVNFEDCLLLIKVLALKKLKNYHKGIREAEVHLRIPSCHSILNAVFKM